MKRLALIGFWVLLGFTFIFGAWYVLHGDIQYTSDVARDFLLLREISQKGIVLIGPSSSTKLFHGILWMYLNYPIFALSNGNPVASGWFWVFLSVVSVASGFYVAKKLFSSFTAYIYTLIYSSFLAFHVRYFYNPDGAMLVMPFVFYSFIRFIQTKQIQFLLLHTILLGAVIQFQMAIGIPLSILSFGYVVWKTIQWKKYMYLLSFLLVILLQMNFVVFDLRHQFLISKLVFHFLTSAGRDHVNIFTVLWQRLYNMTATVEFLRNDMWGLNAVIAIVTFVFVLLHIRQKKFALIYKSFLYFYVGFFILSIANAGNVLYFYRYPLFPLVFLIFSSFVASKYKVIFIVAFACIYVANIFTAVSDMQAERQLYAGKAQDSWKSYNIMATTVFQGKENAFGYFVFDPDIVAYQPKYALFYESKISTKKAYYFEKKPVTYLVIAPRAYHEDVFWKEKLLHIEKTPVQTTLFSNGYTVEKYMLTDKEITIPVEPNIDPGLMFR